MASFIRRRPFLSAALLIGTPTSLYLSSLSSRYPPLTPPRSSPLWTPDKPDEQRLEDVALFAARVPLREVLPLARQQQQPPAGHKETEEEEAVDLPALTAALVHAFLATPLIRLETALVNAHNPFSSSTTSSSSPPPSPTSPSLSAGSRLLGGALQIVHPPLVPPSEPGVGRLTVKWAIDPPDAVRFFEWLAGRWGYPWRLMSGGRHVFEVEVVSPAAGRGSSFSSSSFSSTSASTSPSSHLAIQAPDDEPLIELRLGCAHDYALFHPSPSSSDDGKKIPAWTSWLHLMYARMLLDGAVRGMRREAKAEAARRRERGGEGEGK